jgi:hypothetical protein
VKPNAKQIELEGANMQRTWLDPELNTICEQELAIQKSDTSIASAGTDRASSFYGLNECEELD